MFELHDISLLAAAQPMERVLLGNVSAGFPPGELVALAGPPGAGKSLLLQVLAGVRAPTFGKVVWSGKNPRPAIAYRPSLPFSAGRAEQELTPAEQVAAALRLRVGRLEKTALACQTAELLEKTGLANVAATRAAALSREQRRRLELALELAGSPGLLLWDERDEGIGPEFDRLLRSLAAELHIAIVRATHALDRLESFSSVVVLASGHLAYHGPADCLAHYFQLATPGELYTRLSERAPENWQRSWAKHGAAFEKSLPQEPPREAAPKPGAVAQWRELVRRRYLLAVRDRRTLGRQLTLLFAFPLAAALFAMGGLPRFINLAGQLHGDLVTGLRENAALAMEAAYGVRLVTNLTMAQLVLLAFLTAHGTAREISGEKRFLETEKLRGLRVGSYIAAKAAFLLPYSAVQAAWMGCYVHWVCRLPGHLGSQMGVLALANAAFACMCLAVSSFARNPERSRRLCFALAALQLPFSGVLLAPPEWLSWILRPLAPLYWGSNAYLESMNGTPFYEALQVVNPSSPFGLCLGMLAVQLSLALGQAFAGCKMSGLRVAPRHRGI